MAEQAPGRMSRRRFLLGAAGISVAVLGGAGYWALRQPELAFIETSYTGSTNKRVLVAYGSQYGSTGGVAEAVGQALQTAGANVDVRRIGGTSAINAAGYDAAIIGAPVISSEWMPVAVEFVRTNEAVLSGIPTAYFLTGMELALTHDLNEAQTKFTQLLEGVVTQVPSVQPLELGVFAGALDYQKMTPAMQALYRLFSEDDTDGDYRDFSAIRAWGSSLAPRLLG